MAFLRKPVLDFSLKPLGPIDVTAIPILSQFISYMVEQALDPLVEPNFVEFPRNRRATA
jgi:Ca2+-dependent lipid-binding protein